jgi:hypothetical protein
MLLSHKCQIVWTHVTRVIFVLFLEENICEMKRLVLALSVMLLNSLATFSLAQSDFQTWLTYNNQTRLSQKWGYTFDLNYRTRGFFPFQSNLAAARAGVIYFLTNEWRFSGGYAWFGTSVRQVDNRWLHEHRLWQQALWLKRHSNLVISNRVRIEERFRQFEDFFKQGPNGISFTMRYRYMLQVQGPVIPARTDNGFQLNWQAANEIMFQTGDLTGGNAFNQNRTLAGFILSPNRQIELAVLYQYILQFQPALSDTEEIHSIRLTFLHQLDFR